MKTIICIIIISKVVLYIYKIIHISVNCFDKSTILIKIQLMGLKYSKLVKYYFVH